MEASTSSGGMLDYSTLADFSNRVEIYQGRHSRVWTAICTKTKKSVIVKGYIKDKMVARHFTQVSREIEIMKKINHLGVVMILGTFQDARCIYIVQEHCQRGDLFNRLMDRGGMLGEAEVAAKVCTPMLIALAKCHALNILHRDIKPENIFIDKEDRIRLGDFGLAVDKLKDRPVSRIGTLDYMAPEVIAMPAEQDAAKGPVKTYDEKVDVWAVGILAYECIAGRPPFEVEDERQTTFLIVTAQISSFPPQFSSLAIDFIQLSLRKDPRQRPSAAKLLQHPWIFPHYKRYVEETGDDLIGLFGPATLPQLQQAAASGAAAAASTSGANRPSAPPAMTTPLRNPAEIALAPKTPGSSHHTPSGFKDDQSQRNGKAGMPTAHGKLPPVSNQTSSAASHYTGGGQGVKTSFGGAQGANGAHSQASPNSPMNKTPLFNKGKVAPVMKDSHSAPVDNKSKQRFSVAGMFSKLLTDKKGAK